MSEDWNLDEVCIRKVIKCLHLNLLFGVLSIKLCDSVPDFNVHGSVHHNNIQIYIQQDAMLHSLFYLETALHVSGGTIHPSSGAQTTVSTATGICHTVIAICSYRGRVGTGLRVQWLAYATRSTLKPVPTLPR